MASDNRFHDELVKGIWKENPVFVSALGLCPALAVTNSLINGIAMGAATFFVLFGSSLLVSTFRNIIPKPVRISLYILIIATFVTMVDFALAAVLPDIHKALGAFISLIVVNCLILGRQESFASKNSVGVSLADAIGMASGFTLALAMIGGVREILGNGSLLGFPLFGDGFEPWVIMILPPGGFFTMGTLIFLFSWFKERKEKKTEKKATEQDNSFESWVV
ncbi:MAG: electron transport complex subunit RsxE [Acidobacteria bacterium]|nr:MAG: electron transport complex subunit RsxE [Acidobacteriota bacterium]